MYDIKYKDKESVKEIYVDLEGFKWSKSIARGFGNLNSKAFKAIKEITGCEPTSCKLGKIYKI